MTQRLRTKLLIFQFDNTKKEVFYLQPVTKYHSHFSDQSVDESLRQEACENWKTDKDAMLSVLKHSATEAIVRKVLPASVCRKYISSGKIPVKTLGKLFT